MNIIPYKRLLGGFIFILGFSVLMFLYLINLQLRPESRSFLEGMENRYQTDVRIGDSERGRIYDRNNHLMSGNILMYEVSFNMQDAKYDSETAYQTMVQMLNITDPGEQKALKERLTLKDKYDERAGYVRSFVSADIKNKLTKKAEELQAARTEASLRGGNYRAMPSLSGMYFKSHLARIYPEQTLGSNILGYYTRYPVKFDNQNAPVPEKRDDRVIRNNDATANLGPRAFFGVEEAYDEALTGESKNKITDKDPRKQNLNEPNKAGTSLILTIDRNIQALAERTLDKWIKQQGSEYGVVVVYDPKTGEVLAMASAPRIDPNEYWNMETFFPKGSKSPFNKAIMDTYEPGSVFKVLTMAAAIDAGKVTVDTHRVVERSIRVGPSTFYNWDRGAWGDQTMLGCMQHSLNVCLVWVAQQLGPTRFFEYLNNFGIGKLTGIDLAKEANITMRLPNDPLWSDDIFGANSFGQSIEATAIQMTAAISAVANNGVIMRPHIVKATVENGVRYEKPLVKNSAPLKPSTAKTMTEMLRVSLEKEASNALVDNYSIAGKTGTAQIFRNGIEETGANASFVGWGPSEDPQFVVYIWLEKPKGYWGSAVAAPMFSEFTEQLVTLMGIPPDNIRQKLK